MAWTRRSLFYWQEIARLLAVGQVSRPPEAGETPGAAPLIGRRRSSRLLHARFLTWRRRCALGRPTPPRIDLSGENARDWARRHVIRG